jgi:hypothetical protein
MKLARRMLLVWLAACSFSADAAACPFCTTLKPTLVERRETADVVAIGECLEAGSKQAVFRIDQTLQGTDKLAKVSTDRLSLDVDRQIKPGSLVILFAEESGNALRWSCEPANELGLSYFVKAPGLRVPATERLQYFVRYLEHADPLAAEDAFNEFGHAPYEAVERTARHMDATQLRRWLADPNVRDERKGFYGLALGLAGREQDRPRQEAFLREQIERSADDFRAGFDGLLGGYLVLAGEPALELVEQHYLSNPRARVGDVRHAMTAVRFYQEFGREISTPRLAQALEPLLERPEFAAEAVVDLARWKHWDAAGKVASLYTLDPPAAAATRRAIVGYLLACPTPRGATELARLRQLDGHGVAEAELALQISGIIKQD